MRSLLCRAGVRHTDLVALLTTTEAAKRADVMPHRIADWRRRGLLPVASRTANGRPLYHPHDVARAERDTRHASRGLDGRWTTVAPCEGRRSVPSTR